MTYLLPTTNNTVQVVFGAGLTTYGGNITISTTQSATVSNIGAVEVDLIVNVSGSVSTTGTGPSLVFTLSEIDPGNLTTTIGNSVSGATITATGSQTLKLQNTTTGAVKVSFTSSSTTGVPTFNGVYVTLVFRTVPTNDPSIPVSVLTGVSGAITVGSNLSTNLLNVGHGAGIYGPFVNKEIDLTINVTSFSTLTGLSFTMAEVDPQNTGTTIGTSVTGTNITAAGTQQLKLADTTTGYVKITYTATGTAGTNTVFVTLTTKQTEDIIEQYAPAAEDNVNGVIAYAVLPLSVAQYTPSYSQTIDGYAGALKTSPGNLRSFKLINKGTTAVYLQFFNQTTSPAGTTPTPVDEWLVPAGPSMIIVGEDFFSTNGVNFTTGIAWGVSSATNGTYSQSGLTSTNYTFSATYK